MAQKNRGTERLPFGKILTGVMKERGLTLKQVAELSGVRISVVQGWLSGANPHDLWAVNQLAKGLGISFQGLLLGESDSVGTPSLHTMFEERELFDGLCQVTIKRLVPRKESRE